VLIGRPDPVALDLVVDVDQPTGLRGPEVGGRLAHVPAELAQGGDEDLLGGRCESSFGVEGLQVDGAGIAHGVRYSSLKGLILPSNTTPFL
jgi:hypothetical protein